MDPKACAAIFRNPPVWRWPDSRFGAIIVSPRGTKLIHRIIFSNFNRDDFDPSPADRLSWPDLVSVKTLIAWRVSKVRSSKQQPETASQQRPPNHRPTAEIMRIVLLIGSCLGSARHWASGHRHSNPSKPLCVTMGSTTHPTPPYCNHSVHRMPVLCAMCIRGCWAAASGLAWWPWRGETGRAGKKATASLSPLSGRRNSVRPVEWPGSKKCNPRTRCPGLLPFFPVLSCSTQTVGCEGPAYITEPA